MFRARRFAGVAVQRTQRIANWQKLVSPWASKEYVSALASQISLVETTTQAASAVKPAQDIDWAYWEKTIKAPGVVAALKKEFADHKFTEIKATHTVASIAHNDKIIDDAKKILPHCANEAKLAEEKVQELKRIHKEDLPNWGYEDVLGFIPGLHEELLERFERDEWMPTESEDNLMESLELGELVKSLKEGSTPVINLPDDHKDSGDYLWDEESALLAANEWSIARWNMCKEERAEIHQSTLELLGRTKSESNYVAKPKKIDVYKEPWEIEEEEGEKHH